jgi:hypothetical protein
MLHWTWPGGGPARQEWPADEAEKATEAFEYSDSVEHSPPKLVC